MTVVLGPSAVDTRILSGCPRYDDDALQYEQCINFQGVVTRKIRNGSEMKSFTSESMDGSSTIVDGSDSDSDSISITTTRRLPSDGSDNFNIMHGGAVEGEDPLQGELPSEESQLSHLPNRLTSCTSNLVGARNRGSPIVNNIEEDYHGDATEAPPEVKIVVANPHDMIFGMSRVLSKTIQISSSAREFACSQEYDEKEEMTYALEGRFCGGLLDVAFHVEELVTFVRQGPAREELARRIPIEDLEVVLQVDVTHVLVDQDWVDIHYYVNAVFDAITSEEAPHSIILRGVVKK